VVPGNRIGSTEIEGKKILSRRAGQITAKSVNIINDPAMSFDASFGSQDDGRVPRRLDTLCKTSIHDNITEWLA